MRSVGAVIRIYEPLTLIISTQGAEMPLNLAEAPPCLFCRHSRLPPAKTVWIGAGDVETLAVICADCDYPDQAELERKIAEQVSAQEPIAA
jgi:hypothetical protein